MHFFNEQRLEDVGLQKQKVNVLNERALCPNLQTFYSDVPLTPQISEQSVSVDIPINKRLSEMFTDARNAQELDQYVKANADITLSSQFDPGHIPLTATPAPLSDTIKAELFTSSPLKRMPNFNVNITDNGRHIEVTNFADDGFCLKGFRFGIQAGNTHDAISMIQENGNVILMGELKSFNDGHSEKTSGDIVPYLLADQGNWTCLYWPDSKFIAEADGTMGVSFNDYIYLFRN